MQGHSRARDALLQKRYAPRIGKPRRIACLTVERGRYRVLVGLASEARSRGGCLYRMRIRLVKRFGLSAFERLKD